MLKLWWCGILIAAPLALLAEVQNNIEVVQTATAVSCGEDVSLDIYRSTPSGRKLLLHAQGSHRYGSHFSDAQFSAPDANGNRLLFLSWFGVQCGSNWNRLEYRLYRINAQADSLVPVFSDSHSFVLGQEMSATVAPDELLLKLTAEDLEAGFRRTHILRYRVGQNVERIDPVARQPKDFVHEWLTRPSSEMRSRSAPTVATWHRRLHDLYGEYSFVQPCQQRPNSTQVGITAGNQNREAYFLVEDRGDSHFYMSDVSFTRQRGCPGNATPPAALP